MPNKIPLPLILLFLLVAVLLGGGFLPLEFKSFFLAVSLTLKSILLFVLPAIIFIYLFSCFSAFEGNVFLFMVVLLLGVCASNFLGTMVAYGLTHMSLPTIACSDFSSHASLAPYWNFTLPKLISNEWALFFGFACGALVSFFPHPTALKVGTWGKKGAKVFLDKFFIPLMPFFVLGFLLKMQEEGVLWYLVKTYSPILAMLAATYVVYLFFLYWVAAKGNVTEAMAYIRRALPAGLTGFSSMSSAAALPLTLKAAEHNSAKPGIVRAIIPATVNIHLVGDSIGVPIIAMAILMTFGHGLPDFSGFLLFSFYFVLAKFAVAAVPGGGILVMLPVLEKTLGFNGEMLGLITALYVLFDPLFTATNVMGNGAFSVILSRVFKK